jgi:predicted nucleic acid-binding protein
MRSLPSIPTLVIDASVVVKWVLEDEPLAHEARDLFADAIQRRRRLVGPPLLIAESTNAIYQRFRRKDLTADEADQLVGHIWSRPLDLMSTPDLTQRTYRFVRQHRLANVYDSHYVVLAQELGTEFWTGDERIFNSVRAVAPWVKWLGDYSTGDDDE